MYEMRCIEWYFWNDWLKQDVNIRVHNTLCLVQDTQNEMHRHKANNKYIEYNDGYKIGQ